MGLRGSERPLPLDRTMRLRSDLYISFSVIVQIVYNGIFLKVKTFIFLLVVFKLFEVCEDYVFISVCHSLFGGGGGWQGGYTWQGGMCGGGACVAREGHAWRGATCVAGVGRACVQEGWPLKQVVRILLECILT